MTERRLGVVIFAVVAAGLTTWAIRSLPSTDVEPTLTEAVASDRPMVVAARPTASRASKPRRLPQVAPSGPSDEDASADEAENGPPRWQLDNPERSVDDWNYDMAELLDAYDACPELQGPDAGDEVTFVVRSLRAMYDDESFHPNASVGTYQAATAATNAVRDLLDREGC